LFENSDDPVVILSGAFLVVPVHYKQKQNDPWTKTFAFLYAGMGANELGINLRIPGDSVQTELSSVTVEKLFSGESIPIPGPGLVTIKFIIPQPSVTTIRQLAQEADNIKSRDPSRTLRTPGFEVVRDHSAMIGSFLGSNVRDDHQPETDQTRRDQNQLDWIREQDNLKKQKALLQAEIERDKNDQLELGYQIERYRNEQKDLDESSSQFQISISHVEKRIEEYANEAKRRSALSGQSNVDDKKRLADEIAADVTTVQRLQKQLDEFRYSRHLLDKQIMNCQAQTAGLDYVILANQEQIRSIDRQLGLVPDDRNDGQSGSRNVSRRLASLSYQQSLCLF
jgi:hypothetical protein